MPSLVSVKVKVQVAGVANAAISVASWPVPAPISRTSRSGLGCCPPGHIVSTIARATRFACFCLWGSISQSRACVSNWFTSIDPRGAASTCGITVRNTGDAVVLASGPKANALSFHGVVLTSNRAGEVIVKAEPVQGKFCARPEEAALAKTTPTGFRLGSP